MTLTKPKPKPADATDDPTVRAEQAKLDKLTEQIDRIDAELSTTPERLVIARRDLELQRKALREAADEQRAEIHAALDKVVRVKLAELTPKRAELLRNIDMAVESLIDATELHEKFIDECESAGIIPQAARINGRWTFPITFDVPRLHEWRAIFKRNGFSQ